MKYSLVPALVFSFIFSISAQEGLMDERGFYTGSRAISATQNAEELKILPTSFVVPSRYTTEFGEKENSIPFAFLNKAVRYQQVFLSSEIGKGKIIKELCFRLDENIPVPTAAHSRNIKINLGLSDKAPGNMSTVFSENFLYPKQLVYTGPINIPPTTPGTVTINSFDVCVTFDTPFKYDGLQNLLVEILVEPGPGFSFLDYCTNCNTQRMYNTNDIYWSTQWKERCW